MGSFSIGTLSPDWIVSLAQEDAGKVLYSEDPEISGRLADMWNSADAENNLMPSHSLGFSVVRPRGRDASASSAPPAFTPVWNDGSHEIQLTLGKGPSSFQAKRSLSGQGVMGLFPLCGPHSAFKSGLLAIPSTPGIGMRLENSLDNVGIQNGSHQVGPRRWHAGTGQGIEIGSFSNGTCSSKLSEFRRSENFLRLARKFFKNPISALSPHTTKGSR